jgi:hypothetical protein
MQFNYSFNINTEFDGNGKKTSRAYISSTNLPMLGYLSTNSLVASIEVVAELQAQLKDQDREEFDWGADFCIITTKGNISTIEHNDMSVENWRETFILTEVETNTLLTLMQDWVKILQAISN